MEGNCIHSYKDSGHTTVPAGKCSLLPFVKHLIHCKYERFATHSNNVKCDCGLAEALSYAN